MTLLVARTFNGLPVCDRCGWPMAGPYEEDRHRANCTLVAAGNSATKLAERLPAVPSTKYGYGTGRLVFSVNKKNLHVRFECHSNGTFHLEDVWCLDSLTRDDAAALVAHIVSWNSDRRSR